MKQNSGTLFFACLWLVLGILLFVQYSRHGFITLKEGTVIYGSQAVIVFSILLIIGVTGAFLWVKAKLKRKS